MVCRIDIIDFRGITDGGTLDRIEVEGEATECPSDTVDVKIECDSEESDILTVPLNGPGLTQEWSATFTDIPDPCGCSEWIRIGVQCSGEPDCEEVRGFNNLPCAEEGESICPEVKREDYINELDTTCTDGKRHFLLEIPLESSGFFEAELRDSDGDVLVSVSGRGRQTLHYEADLEPRDDDYEFDVEVTEPPDCDPFSVPITVHVAECPTECPGVSWKQRGPSSECNDDGGRATLVTATVKPDDPTYRYSAKFRIHELDDTGDRTSTTLLDEAEDSTGKEEFEFSDALTPGSYEFEVKFKDEDCDSDTLEVGVEKCCPTWDWVHEGVGPCQNGTRQVKIHANLESPGNYSAELLGPDGEEVDRVSDVSGSETLTFEDNRHPSSEEKVELNISDPPDCPHLEALEDKLSHPFTVPECEDGDRDGDGGRSTLCWILGILWAVALGSILGWVASGVAIDLAVSFGLAIVGALGVAFASRCGLCDWARFTLAGLVLFAIALIIMLIFEAAPMWLEALIAAIGFLIGAITAILERC